MPVAELRGLAAAIAFLTRVPLGRFIRLDPADVARGGALFPLVGAGIGTAVGGIAQELAPPLTAPLAALVGLAIGAALTGMLHLDGLADSADALGATSREHALEIMRDHAVGAYGAVALVLDLGLKAVALAVLAMRHDALRYAVCAVAAARVAPVALSFALPYARANGTGGALRGTGGFRVVVAAAIAVAFAVLLHAAVTLVGTAVVIVLVGAAARYALGGITGDVLGAASELCEIAALVCAVAVT
jgi:cobalamin 5'-phosphate synthase/cobalamin synthase